ncbi:MAG: DUF2271 domain-containing protein [Rhodobacteraceae bacterium]|nr:DUF2271 domain-containing protein [Paracoccaceae bacterium]
MSHSATSLNKLSRFFGASLIALCAAQSAQAVETTILVQINEYEGEKAYFSLYLVDPDGRYDRTLWVSGDETKYFPDMPRWFRYLSRNAQELDAITGASTGAGDRAVLTIEIDESLIDAGYALRVETAVEDRENYDEDVEVDLTTDNQGTKFEGSGYVRYIRYKF